TDYGQLWQQAGIMGAYAAGFALLSILMFNRLVRKQAASAGTSVTPVTP
ncbi:MAG: hypothetical protein JWN15_2445, partial [Firmicutes bacterium]|nr:hypothetical protein [Bacillota bacterium]